MGNDYSAKLVNKEKIAVLNVYVEDILELA